VKLRRHHRHQRVGEQLHRELSELLRTEIRDPFWQPLTITEVRVVEDLSWARIYVTAFQRETLDAGLKILRQAGPFLRQALGKRLRLRQVPQLQFLGDDALHAGEQMDALINAARARDAALQEPIESGSTERDRTRGGE